MSLRREGFSLQRIRNGFGAWVEFVLPGVAARWADQGLPREGRPFVLLNISDVPSGRAAFDSRIVREAPTSLLVTVDAAVDGHTYGYVINDTHIAIDGEAGDTVTTVRDRLAAAITAQITAQYSTPGITTPPRVAVTPVGAPSMRLIPEHEDDLVTARPYVSSSNLTQVVESSSRLEEATGQRVGTLTVECYSSSGTGPNTADQLAATLISSLESTDVLSVVDEYGIETQGPSTEPRDLSELVGPSRERRVQFETRFAVVSRFASKTAELDTIRFTGSNPTNPITVTRE